MVHNRFKDLGCDHLETLPAHGEIRPEPMLELLPDDPLDLVLRGGANDPREDRRDLRVVLIRVLAEVDSSWVMPEEDGLDLFVQTGVLSSEGPTVLARHALMVGASATTFAHPGVILTLSDRPRLAVRPIACLRPFRLTETMTWNTQKPGAGPAVSALNGPTKLGVSSAIRCDHMSHLSFALGKHLVQAHGWQFLRQIALPKLGDAHRALHDNQIDDFWAGHLHGPRKDSQPTR